MTRDFRSAVTDDRVYVFDGAMGTMLYSRGVYINRCYDELNLTNPELVLGVQREYVKAGADIVESNTYGANRSKLSGYGLEDKIREMNREGVRLAREAAGDRSFVAGAIGPLGIRIEPYGPTSTDEAQTIFREQAVALVAETRPTGVRGASAAADARQMLSDAMQQWLITLGTQNTKAAYFDDDFTLFVDGAKFATTTHQSGSTRTRIVLAFHAALLEVSLVRGGNHPGWLLFDAPKQHELSQTDFDAYTERLQMIAARYPGRVQVVFSVADLKTQFQAGDEVWQPTFTIDGKPRFLGPVEEKHNGQPPTQA